MKIGDVVRSKDGSTYGTINFSTFGYSVHFWNEEYHSFGKTLGQPESEVLKYWEVCELPEGYYIDDLGTVRKK